MEQTLNKSQHRKLTLEKKILLPLLPDSSSQPFAHKSGTLLLSYPDTPPPPHKHLNYMFSSPGVIKRQNLSIMLTLLSLELPLSNLSFGLRQPQTNQPWKSNFLAKLLQCFCTSLHQTLQDNRRCGKKNMTWLRKNMLPWQQLGSYFGKGITNNKQILRLFKKCFVVGLFFCGFFVVFFWGVNQAKSWITMNGPVLGLLHPIPPQDNFLAQKLSPG